MTCSDTVHQSTKHQIYTTSVDVACSVLVYLNERQGMVQNVLGILEVPPYVVKLFKLKWSQVRPWFENLNIENSLPVFKILDP